jgi:hypothetical protein
MPRALKDFRTSAGLHDAYVTAPSRKAALAAWGADVDLFARGVAEHVTDKALMAEPLKKPGEVIMKSRGGLADQLKALGPRKARRKEDAPASNAKPRAVKPPSRARLDKADAALADAEQRQASDRAALEAQREAIERKIAALEARQAKELSRFKQRRNRAREAYQDALDRLSE